MLSLAPIKYRNIFSSKGGPIEKLLWSPAQISHNLQGYEASCHLRSDLRPANLFEYKLYGNPDGTGSDKYKSTACYKAISESLERWAYYEVGVSSQSEVYGFKIDSSTNGMAAFPGLTNKAARSAALFEALERWALVEWWSGKLSCNQYKKNNINFIEILIPNIGAAVISWIPVLNSKKTIVAYGFAAAKTPMVAFARSQAELFRNIFVLERHAKSSEPVQMSELNIQEQRLLWFSTESGHQNFLEKINSSLNSAIINTVPKLILDTEIIGPWSQYTTVWRCLFRTSVSDHGCEESVNFFFF